MKKIFWLVQTEIDQSRSYFTLIFFTAFVMGSSFSLIKKAEKKILEISSEASWDADILVVPKGITLIDFKKEILSGDSSALIPEALFDTTLQITKGAIKATALLSFKKENQIEVMFKGDQEVGLNWLPQTIVIKPYETQNSYQTKEWGNKVVAGFFIKAPFAMIKEIKELIDRKTVAQAIVINQQVKNDNETRDQLQKALTSYSSVLLAMIFLTIGSLYLIMKNRLKVSLIILDEIGFSRTQLLQFSLQLFIISIFLPITFGFIFVDFFIN